ncbi:MAG: HPF/RaiA family ribosome-associated protein [bacterium]|nr:HPF/RaiA family ribosome-associated protein [bacterium]MCP5066153.1 HPF/RaiA family ribosome-associated protein [bacterium]
MNEHGGLMANGLVAMHIKDTDLSEEARRRLEARCQSVVEEFPELTHLEISVAPEGLGHTASAHATGKHTEAATHAKGEQAAQVADLVLHKLEHQLRRVHDKRIFARRRDARQHTTKRNVEG